MCASASTGKFPVAERVTGTFMGIVLIYLKSAVTAQSSLHNVFRRITVYRRKECSHPLQEDVSTLRGIHVMSVTENGVMNLLLLA